MYTLNLNPTLLELGQLEIRWYGLIYAFGFILFYLTMYYVSKKNLIENLDKNNVDNYVLYIILGVVICARFFDFVFYNFKTIFTDPLEILKIWHGGLSFHGALIGFILGTWLFCKKYKINIWKTLDVSAIVVIFAVMLGRIGNLINAELIGTPFNGSWCVIFPNYDTVCRHPYPIYAALSHLLLFLYLIFLLYKNKENIKDYLGKRNLTISFFIGYGILRIITDIWKVDNIVLGIKTGQWLSLVMVLIGILLIIFNKRKQKPL